MLDIREIEEIYKATTIGSGLGNARSRTAGSEADAAVVLYQPTASVCFSITTFFGGNFMADKTNTPHRRPVVDTSIGSRMHTLTALAFGVVVIVALYFGQEVLLPVTVAVLLSFVLSPLVNLLRKLHIPHVVAVVFSVTVALGLIGGVAALVGSQLVDVAADLPRYQSTIEEKIDTVRGATVKRLSSFAASLKGALKETPQQPTSAAPAEEQNNSVKAKPIPVEVHNPRPILSR